MHNVYLIAASGRGSGRALYLLFQWLWSQLHWWATPIYAVFTAAGLGCAWYGRDSDG